MMPRPFTFGHEPAVAPVEQRDTSPLEPGASPSSIARITEPLESPPSGVRERLTEPLNVASHGPTLPFAPASPAPWSDAPNRPALMPGEATPESSRPRMDRDAVRAFCLAVVGVIVLCNVALWIVLALRLAPTPAPVVAPSLPAAIFAALASARPPAPEPSAAPAVTSSAASLAASATPASAPLPPLRAASQVRSPASLAPSVAVPRSRAPLPRSEVVDPWGAGR